MQVDSEAACSFAKNASQLWETRISLISNSLASSVKENKTCHTTRREWWRRIRANESLLAKNISEALNRTFEFEDLDAEFGHDVDTFSARTYREKKAAKQSARSDA